MASRARSPGGGRTTKFVGGWIVLDRRRGNPRPVGTFRQIADTSLEDPPPRQIAMQLDALASATLLFHDDDHAIVRDRRHAFVQEPHVQRHRLAAKILRTIRRQFHAAAGAQQLGSGSGSESSGSSTARNTRHCRDTATTGSFRPWPGTRRGPAPTNCRQISGMGDSTGRRIAHGLHQDARAEPRIGRLQEPPQRRQTPPQFEIAGRRVGQLQLRTRSTQQRGLHVPRLRPATTLRSAATPCSDRSGNRSSSGVPR